MDITGIIIFHITRVSYKIKDHTEVYLIKEQTTEQKVLTFEIYIIGTNGISIRYTFVINERSVMDRNPMGSYDDYTQMLERKRYINYTDKHGKNRTIPLLRLSV